MNDSEFEKLSEKSRRGELTPDEAAEFRGHLIAHPAAQAAWEEDEALAQLVAQLPDAPMPSNFTARVLTEVARESRPVPPPVRAAWSGWLATIFKITRPQRVALAAAAVCAGLLTFQQFRAHHRAQVAESLAKFTGATELPGVEALKDFDAIRRLSLLPAGVDAELVSALSQPNDK
ncbi:MAG: hypothetical protein HY301_06670 [Verrucomicrobia bacterium]|nr:hypothetical protein [Verrucomicrobiota bacterium]